MSAPQWKPGTVASFGHTIAFRTEEGWAYRDGSVGGSYQDAHTGIRPLVVIDPEDREQVAAFRDALDPSQMKFPLAAYQQALRSLVTPPKPQVYSHIRAVEHHGISSALCGKTWRAGEDVEVVGQCPECRELAEEWVS